jgi:hypothetical protein
MRIEDINGTVVAIMEMTKVSIYDQLNDPHYICVDEDHSVYI